MRQELVRFFESVVDETVISFIIANLSSDGLAQLFDYLEYCDVETKERWHVIYSELFDNAMQMKKKRG